MGIQSRSSPPVVGRLDSVSDQTGNTTSVDTAVVKAEKFLRMRRILASVAVVPWACLLWSGYDLCYGPGVRAVPGYPNEGQVHLYVVFPFIGLVICVALLVLAIKIPTWQVVFAFCVEILALLPLVFFWGGGV